MLVEISHVNSSPTFDRICEKALRAQSAAAYRRGDSWPREVRRCLIYRELHSRQPPRSQNTMQTGRAGIASAHRHCQNRCCGSAYFVLPADKNGPVVTLSR